MRVRVDRRLEPALKILPVLVILLGLPLFAAASGPEDFELMRKNIIGDREGAFEEKAWVEFEHQLPPAPEMKNLIPIEIGSLSANRFAVDEPSVTFGPDGVIRYTLIVTSPGGARNVSYEGMRCSTAERRLYAIGRADGTWVKPRSGNQWVRIAENNHNRHHAALFRDYFCTAGGTVGDTEEARRVLPKGNPAAALR